MFTKKPVKMMMMNLLLMRIISCFTAFLFQQDQESAAIQQRCVAADTLVLLMSPCLHAYLFSVVEHSV